MTRQLPIKNLEDKVDLISALTGVRFKFVSQTRNPNLGYILLADKNAMEMVWLPSRLGYSRREANRTLDAILGGIELCLGSDKQK